jgi:hypothetical protein
MPSGVEFVYVDAPSLARGDFGWWHEGFAGWERTLSWAVDLLESQSRFDGLFGFSQGAALTGLLAAANESDLREMGHPWFDFAVMVGGFKSGSPQHADLFRRELALPSVHVMGRRDGIVPIGDSRVLAGQFHHPLVLEHDGGHVVPAIDSVIAPLARFLTDRLDPAPSRPGKIQTESVHHG